MNKPKDYTLLAIGLVLLLAILAASCERKSINTHHCRWSLCPYQGIDTAKAKQVVANYIGEAGVEGYYIALLHIQYPEANYATLDSLLTH